MLSNLFDPVNERSYAIGYVKLFIPQQLLNLALLSEAALSQEVHVCTAFSLSH